MHILAFVCTRGRYDTTLPLTLESIVLQRRKLDELLIYEDGEKREIWKEEKYQPIFRLIQKEGIGWRIAFGQGNGQHHGHQLSQELAKEWIWRVDDDEIPEPNCLGELVMSVKDGVGAVGGNVLVPEQEPNVGTGVLLEDVASGKNIQWGGNVPKEVEHLHSTFLYRRGIAMYDTRLSRVAHREETMFTHEIFRRGYKLLFVPSAVTWHFRSDGGIRTGTNDMFRGDEWLFQRWLKSLGRKIAYLDNGLGDHLAFNLELDDLRRIHPDLEVACVHPEVFSGKTMSIQDAQAIGVNPLNHNVYAWMRMNDWKGKLHEAFLRMYS